MKFIILGLTFLYIFILAYIYLTQDAQVFNRAGVDEDKPFVLENTQNISLQVDDNIILDGVYKHSLKNDAPLLLYFGGNADDATRILLHVKSLGEFDIISFNYRGYLKSSGTPSEESLFSDALLIFDTYAQDKKVVLIGRSLGTGVATYLASKRKVDGLILITPYDSIASIAKKKYPIFPIDFLLRHKFESSTYMRQVDTLVSILEVKDDTVVPAYHLNELKKTVPKLSLHVTLEDTTHAQVLSHKDFEKILREMLEKIL